MELGERSTSRLHHHETHNEKHLHLRPILPFQAVTSLFQIPAGFQVHSRTSTPPLDLLKKCFYTTLALSSVGFISALLGITAYSWLGLQQNVGIFTTGCLGVSIVASVWAMI